MRALAFNLMLMLAGTSATLAADASDDSLKRFAPEYKKPIEVPESLFNPFKIQTINDLAPRKKEAASVTNEQVAEAIGKRGLSAILYAPDPRRSRMVLGDQNFVVGDELVFVTDKGESDGLVAGVSVFLREIGPRSLQIEIATQGEASRLMTFSLREFYR